jgi:hypothetical protein
MKYTIYLRVNSLYYKELISKYCVYIYENFSITDIAEEEILNTVKYITDVLKAPIAANDLLDEIEKYENILENTPDIFSFVPDEHLRTKGIKYVMVKNI